MTSSGTEHATFWLVAPKSPLSIIDKQCGIAAIYIFDDIQKLVLNLCLLLKYISFLNLSIIPYIN
jgi:hypothetical protein